MLKLIIMGNKGDKLSDQSVTAAAKLVDMLAPIGNITSKKMFGGHGVFHHGKMFSIIDSKGQAFLKTDDSNKEYFEKVNATKHGRMPYYSIPKPILDQPDELLLWARRSIEISK